jgi:putative CocE/NonD family hydrolase
MVGGHAGTARKVGDIDFGPNAKETVDDWNDWTLQWYDYLFKGAKNQFAAGKPVKIFVMGANEWRDVDEWPIPQAKMTKYFLHSDGKANSVRGDGSLSIAAPGSESVDQFVYNPATPVPTVGGPLCCDAQNWPAGPRDQRAVESRDDVLVYSTPPMKEDLEVTGPITLDLYAKSSEVDTDFTAKLVDVWPNGYAQNLTEGILQTRFRNSREKPELMNPGQVYELSIDLWATSNVFKVGHILRLEVSSSNFPRFNRNPNTGEALSVKSSESGARLAIATNAILHDVEHPSALILPIVPSK